MTQHGPSLEEKLIELLADYDEALAAGDTPADGASAANLPSLQRDQAYLQLLRKALRPGIQTTAPEAAVALSAANATEQGQPGVELPWKTLGRFEIVRELGQGGFGVVLLAWDPLLSRDVALKVPRAEALLTPAFRERFDREARAAASLDHPNIVPVHEVGEAGPLCFIVSAYCPGLSLSGWLAQLEDPVPFEETARLCATLADAVQHAHARGVVHRDLKPSNILLEGASGRRTPHPAADEAGSPSGGVRSPPATLIPRITDFGLAKLVGEESGGEQTQSGAILGTPRYMAPEQAAGKAREVGPSADIYSLGVILYELLTGRTPFMGESNLEILLQVQSDEPVAPSRLRPRVPRDLETICLTCLQKEPHKRYASAQDLAEDLRRFMAGFPIKARATGRVERLWRWCRRKPALAAASVLGVVALAAATGLAVTFAMAGTLRQERDEKEQAFKDADALRGKADRLKRVAEGLATRLALERGHTLCEQANVATGLLWMVRSLQIALADDPDLSEVIRTDLASWSRQLSPLKSAFACTGHIDAVSPDGKIVLARDPQGIELWDTSTGQKAGRRLAHAQAHRALFSRDGKTIVTLGDVQERTIRFWDTASGTLKRDGFTEGTGRFFQYPDFIRDVAFSADGTMMAKAYGWRAVVVDMTTSRSVNLKGGPNRFDGNVLKVLFSGDGKTLLTLTENDAFNLWSVDRNPVRGMRHNGLSAAAINGDAQAVLTASKDGSVRLWKPDPKVDPADEGKTPPYRDQLLGDHQGKVVDMALSPDGKTLVTGSEDRTARLWSLERGKAVTAPLVHQGAVEKVGFSPDGQTVVTASRDGLVRFWETASGRPLGTPLQHAGDIQTVAHGPDGMLVLTTRAGTQETGQGLESTVRLWEMNLRQPRTLPLPLPAGIKTAALSRNGRVLATAEAGATAVRVWATDTGKPLAHIPSPANLGRVALSPAGTILAIATTDGLVRLWETASGRALGDAMSIAEVDSLAFSADARTLAAACRHAQQRTALRLASAPAGKTIAEFVLDERVRTMTFSAEGDTLLAAGPVLAQKWEVAVGKAQGKPLDYLQNTYAVAYSPDGRTLATAADGNVVRLWHTGAGMSAAAPIRPSSEVRALAFSADGRSLITVQDDATVSRWDVSAPIDGDVRRIALWVQTLTGMELTDQDVVRELGVTAWHERGRQLREAGPLPQPRPPSPVPAVGAGETASLWDVAPRPATTRDATRWVLFIGEGRGQVLYEDGLRLLDVAAGKARGFALPDLPRKWVVGADGRTLAALAPTAPSNGPQVRIWDLITGKESGAAQHFQSPTGMTLSPDGKLLATSFPPNITGRGAVMMPAPVKIWDAAAGQELATLQGHLGQVVALAFDPKGRILASSNGPSSPLFRGPPAPPLVIWDVATREKQHVLPHESVYRLAFSPDGQTLASASPSELNLWQVATGKPAGIHKLRLQKALVALVFSPDGRTLVGVTAARSLDGRTVPAAPEQVILWDVTTGKERSRHDVQPGTPSVRLFPDGQTVALFFEGSKLTDWPD